MTLQGYEIQRREEPRQNLEACESQNIGFQGWKAYALNK
jgi:hypothetical protein